MKNIVFIGPRLQKDGPIGWFGEENKHPKQIAILQYLNEKIPSLNTDYCVVTSMRSGIEQWAAEIALRHKIPYAIKLPHEGTENKLPDFAKARYLSLIEKASSVSYINTGEFSVEKMRSADQELCRCADILVSFYVKDIKEIQHCSTHTEIIRPFAYSPPKETENKPADYFIPF